MNAELRGKFITLEGIDGAGKSTHLPWLAEQLSQRGHIVVTTREPGGTALGEKLREILLNESMTAKTEALLMFAARCEHLQQVIWPALKAGQWVLCDRFTDATIAYQGGGRGLDVTDLNRLEHWVHPHFQPDLSLLFDVPEGTSMERLARHATRDRFEREQHDFFKRVRTAYLQRAEQNRSRFRVIDSTRTPNEVRTQLLQIIADL